MGQYYQVYAKNESGEEVVWNVTKISDCGYKLMEHSWLGNSAVNTVMRRLLEAGPFTIIWMGDYADDDKRIDEIENGKECYKFVWGDREDGEHVQPLEKNPVDVNATKYYLVNHTQKVYLDIAKYAEANTDDDGWCIHPLPLLTALGNGNGGGDYFGKNENLVGAWAGDLIGVCEKIVGDAYADITDMVAFKEED